MCGWIDDAVMESEMDMEKYFKFLDTLRDSGRINMYGAPMVLREHYDLTKQESYDIFTAWTEQFS